MSVRPGHAGCHCCDDEPAATYAEFHRDLVTGDVPAAPNELLDAVEELWRCDDGDVTGLTQETVLVNCTGTASVSQYAGNGLDATPGSLRFEFDDIAPTADEFHAVQILWTGEIFDAFSHVSHIAAGSVAALATGRSQSFSESPPVSGDWPSWVGPSTSRTWGIAIRANGLLFLYGGAFGYSDPLLFPPVEDRCWHSQQTTFARVLDGSGEYRLATIDELRAAGLTVDAIATQQTHEVGLYVMLHRVDEFSQFTGLPINPPAASSVSAKIGLDTVGIYAQYRLACTAAFVNLSTLTASMPDHTGQSNVEPYEMRGISCPLTLESTPTWDEDLHSPILSTVYGTGYVYRGTTTFTTYRAGQGGTSETATLEIWYAPCVQLVGRVTVPSKTYDGWFSIDHSDEYSSDACTGSGDSAAGRATAPTFAGHFQRDIRLPCQSAGVGDRLSVPWYGSDCAGRSNETSWVNIHGILGKCQQPMPGSSDPVCTTGLLPNQLTQLTDCYSLDPVAIGYRRRITNQFGLGGFGPCGSAAAPLEKSYPNNAEKHEASVVNPFSSTSGSAEITISLPGHGFSQTIPGSPGIVANSETRDALLDFIQNSGNWPAIPPGQGINVDAYWDWIDANTLSVYVTIGVFGGAMVPFGATSSGSGGGSFDFVGRQAWGHNCQLDVLLSLGLVGFSLDTVIGVGSQLVAGHLYIDITE